MGYWLTWTTIHKGRAGFTYGPTGNGIFMKSHHQTFYLIFIALSLILFTTACGNKEESEVKFLSDELAITKAELQVVRQQLDEVQGSIADLQKAVGELKTARTSSHSSSTAVITDSPTVRPSGTGSTTIHTVEQGESLWTISRKYGTSIDAIKNANQLEDNKIKLGQELRIPQS